MSDPVTLLNLDFNALRTLRLVLRLGSFSLAAEELDVKQSTVSYTINRLRKALEDPLIVRQGGQNVPTQRCRELMPSLERILTEAEQLAYPDGFDPAKAAGEIVFISASTVTTTLIPRVFRRIHAEAPGLRTIVEVGIRDVATPLLNGTADLGIVFNNIEANGIYAHNNLARDYPVCIMDPDNPLVGRTLTIDDLSKSKHVGARLWTGWKQPYMVAAENMGAKIEEALVVNDQLAVPNIIRGTDLIGGMPSSLAEAIGDQIGIAYFPFKLDLDMNMYWSAASNSSPLNIWLRRIVIEEAQQFERRAKGC